MDERVHYSWLVQLTYFVQVNTSYAWFTGGTTSLFPYHQTVTLHRCSCSIIGSCVRNVDYSIYVCMLCRIDFGWSSNMSKICMYVCLSVCLQHNMYV